MENMSWEKSYIQALIEALKPSGNVLQVGYGQGHAATFIADCKPKTHTIIESDPVKAKKAKELSHISVIEGQWQQILPKLGVFDAIFFDDCPNTNTADMTESRERANGALRQGRELMEMIEQQFPHLSQIHYTDEDLEEFYQGMGQQSPKEMSRFLAELKLKGQVSEEQYERMLKKYPLTREVVKIEAKSYDPVFSFLQACLKNHMQKKSRFSCFSITPLSKYENPQFFEHVITNPYLEYRENLIPVEVPPDCEYYKFKEALVMVVECL